MHLILGKLVDRKNDFVEPVISEQNSESDILDPAEEQAEEVARQVGADESVRSSALAMQTPMHYLRQEGEPLFIIDEEDYMENSRHYYARTQRRPSEQSAEEEKKSEESLLNGKE